MDGILLHVKEKKLIDIAYTYPLAQLDGWLVVRYSILCSLARVLALPISVLAKITTISAAECPLMLTASVRSARRDGGKAV